MTKAKLLLRFLGALVVIVLLYLLFWPVPISPQAWTPSPAPTLTGPYQQNLQLATIERLSLGTGSPAPGTGFAPEDVALDAQNRIYTGLDDGRVIRLQADGTHPDTFSNTHGRPLGLVFDANGKTSDRCAGVLPAAGS